MAAADGLGMNRRPKAVGWNWALCQSDWKPVKKPDYGLVGHDGACLAALRLGSKRKAADHGFLHTGRILAASNLQTEKDSRTELLPSWQANDRHAGPGIAAQAWGSRINPRSRQNSRGFVWAGMTNVTVFNEIPDRWGSAGNHGLPGCKSKRFYRNNAMGDLIAVGIERKQGETQRISTSTDRRGR
jgi:hypothetical protein